MPKDKKRIFVVLKSIDGGTGTWAIGLSKLQKFYDIHFLVLEKPAHRKDINIKNISFFHRNNYYSERYGVTPKLIKDITKELLWLRKLINTIKPELVVGADLHPNLLIMICRYITNIKYKTVLTTHIDLASTIKEKGSFALNIIATQLIGRVYDRADKLISVSKGVGSGLKKYFSIKKDILTIYNGIKIPKKIKRQKSDCLKILSVGRLVEQKDYPTLIKAIQIVSVPIPNIKLTIVGDGPLRPSIDKLIKELHLSKQINIVGWVTNTSNHYKNNDIFVLPSKREGLSYALLEAMSYSMPAISSNVNYGPKEIFSGKYGLLFPSGNVRKLAKQILELAGNKKYYSFMSDNAYYRASYFGLSTMLEQYKRVFDSL